MEMLPVLRLFVCELTLIEQLNVIVFAIFTLSITENMDTNDLSSQCIHKRQISIVKFWNIEKKKILNIFTISTILIHPNAHVVTNFDEVVHWYLVRWASAGNQIFLSYFEELIQTHLILHTVVVLNIF